jgi:glycerophosphoryl diester phosphodiesterase
VQVYPGRFPMGKSDFRIHTFEEEIEFVQGLNHSTGKNIGIYPEIKAPWFHHQEGKDIAASTLEVLKSTATPASRIRSICSALTPTS